jgi:carboxylesterase type B
MMWIVGVFHGAEIPFVFHTPTSAFTPAEETLSQSIVQYVTTFARSHNPNYGGESQSWPTYTLAGDLNIVLNTTLSAPQVAMGTLQQCEFWQRLSPGHP